MSYPWKDMPLRKTVGSPYTEFPAVLQTAMTPLVELQRIARDPGYQYVSCESHGPGYQVQWYTRDSKRVKRLAKVQDPMVGGLVRAAALLDPRLLHPDAHYESAMRWLDWLLAVDVDDAILRAQYAETRARSWIEQIWGKSPRHQSPRHPTVANGLRTTDT